MPTCSSRRWHPANFTPEPAGLWLRGCWKTWCGATLLLIPLDCWEQATSLSHQKGPSGSGSRQISKWQPAGVITQPGSTMGSHLPTPPGIFYLQALGQRQRQRDAARRAEPQGTEHLPAPESGRSAGILPGELGLTGFEPHLEARLRQAVAACHTEGHREAHKGST